MPRMRSTSVAVRAVYHDTVFAFIGALRLWLVPAVPRGEARGWPTLERCVWCLGGGAVDGAHAPRAIGTGFCHQSHAERMDDSTRAAISRVSGLA